MNTQARRQFAIVLAKLVSPIDTEHASDVLVEYCELMTDIPDAYFASPGNAALEIAKDMRRMPNYAVLRSAILDWCINHNIPRPGDVPGLSWFENDLLARFLKNDADGWPDMTGIRPGERKARALEMDRHLPALFRHLVETDPECRQIAQANGWIEAPARIFDDHPDAR